MNLEESLGLLSVARQIRFASAQLTGGNVFELELFSNFEISDKTLSFDICHHLPNVNQLIDEEKNV